VGVVRVAESSTAPARSPSSRARTPAASSRGSSAARNTLHPNEKATVIELPESADAQRQGMVKNAVAKSSTYSVLNLDVVWTAEFAANG
jgi:hypothetical protein